MIMWSLKKTKKNPTPNLDAALVKALRRMPAQKPGRSKQDYCTPRALIEAAEEKFGEIEWDLAATSKNRIKQCGFFGPDALQYQQDAMAVEWSTYFAKGSLLWLNPPYSHIAPWAAKCAAESAKGAEILFLVPFTGANWVREHVYGKATIYILNPRPTFEVVLPDGSRDAVRDKQGRPACYPKDLMLAHYQPPNGLNLNRLPLRWWDWKAA